MKYIGIISLILGVLISVYAASMDTTVTYVSGMHRFGKENFNPEIKSVHNVGLIQQKQTTQIIGGLFVVVGVLLIGFSIVAGLAKSASVRKIDRGEDELRKKGAGQSGTGLEDFGDELDVVSPAYQLYLARRYEIEKNNTLEKYTIDDRVFDSLEDALRDAHLRYKKLIDDKKRIAAEAEEQARKVRVEKELRVQKKREEDKRLAPIRAANNRRIATVTAIILTVVVVIALAYNYNERKKLEAMELANKAERERELERQRLAEVARLQQEKKVQGELLEIFSTQSFFGFKLGDNNLERLSSVFENKGLTQNLAEPPEYTIMCHSGACRDILKNSTLDEVLESVTFYYCVPDEKEKKGREFYRMTGFEIKLKNQFNGSALRRYHDFASKIKLPVPPPNVSQRGPSGYGLSLHWEAAHSDRVYNGAYFIKDICKNQRGVFGARPRK